jgi:hypothetical protein
MKLVKYEGGDLRYLDPELTMKIEEILKKDFQLCDKYTNYVVRLFHGVTFEKDPTYNVDVPEIGVIFEESYI